jgi:hypothetical protein
MMANDPPTNQKIVAHQAALLAAGVPAAIISVPQRPLYWPSFFSDQASDVSVDLSARTMTALQEVGGWVGGWVGGRAGGRTGQQLIQIDPTPAVPCHAWQLAATAHRHTVQMFCVWLTAAPNCHALPPLPPLPPVQMGVIDAAGNILANPRRGFTFDWRVGGWVGGWVGGA